MALSLCDFFKILLEASCFLLKLLMDDLLSITVDGVESFIFEWLRCDESYFFFLFVDFKLSIFF